VTVHAPPLLAQAAAHAKPDGELLLGTHGLPQQSAEDAHCVPAGGATQLPPSGGSTLTMRQRGMPSESAWQHAAGLLLQLMPPAGTLTVGSQQLFATLQEFVAVLHVCPAVLQLPPLSQRPNWSVEFVFEQLVPQQSVFFWQISPTGRQPVGSWQTLNPF
jgi:hypothetical protein